MILLSPTPLGLPPTRPLPHDAVKIIGGSHEGSTIYFNGNEELTSSHGNLLLELAVLPILRTEPTGQINYKLLYMWLDTKLVKSFMEEVFPKAKYV